MCVKKIHPMQFLLSIKKMHAKENWFFFLPHGVHMQTTLQIRTTNIKRLLVCVQLLRTRTKWHCPHPAATCHAAAAPGSRRDRSIGLSPSRPAYSNNPPAVGLLLLLQWPRLGQTDERADGRPTVTYNLLRILCGQCQQIRVIDTYWQLRILTPSLQHSNYVDVLTVSVT